MKISCLLTSYNRPHLLPKAIDSVLNQTLQDFELIILDDNSENPEIAKLLVSYWSHPKVVLLKSNTQREERLQTARYATMINCGLKIARGEYISYLCDDDYYMPERFELMAGYLDAHPEVSVVYGSQHCESLTPHLNSLAQSCSKQRVAKSLLSNASFRVDHASVMHRRSVLETVGLWNDDPIHYRHADAIFWKKLTDAGFFFYPIPNVTDVHVFHDGSISDGGWLEKL